MGERQYVKIIKNWLRYEKEYFKEVSPILQRQLGNQQEEVKKDNPFAEALENYKFSELIRVKELGERGYKQIIELIRGKSIAYQIAMLSYLGFVEIGISICKTKFKFEKELAAILKTTPRNVKGNLNVLDEYSKEDRKRYTAHIHKEQVRKDYQNIK